MDNTTMPIIRDQRYPGPPWYQYNGHLQTILPSSFRRVDMPDFERERLELPDGDFLDLDWLDAGSNELIIVSHGLEGNSHRAYVKGMAKFFFDQHWDVLAWNCRSCGGEMNRNCRLYYHGEIEDIHQVIQHAIRQKKYKRIVLVGFSMGGNITLKYVGVHGKNLPSIISHAVAISTPCDLKASIEEIYKPQNRFYNWFFFRAVRTKIIAKAAQFPDQIDVTGIHKIKDWYTFDTRYSAPLNGLGSADEFYYEASSKNFMGGATIPTLIINAKNDPVLDDRSSPKTLIEKHPFLNMQVPKQGGHVGFTLPGKSYTWTELRAWDFCHAR